MSGTVAERQEHVAYFDWLRVISSVMVVTIHCCAQSWYSYPVRSSDWPVLNLYESVSRCCVPVFFMISGALFLGERPPAKKLFTKYIPRLTAVFFFWNLVYALLRDGKAQDFFNILLYGYYHMWFLPVLIGGYLLVPILRLITKDRRILRYYLVLAACTFTLPLVKDALDCLSVSELVTGIVTWPVDMTKLSQAIGITAYLLLGYYLATEPFSARARRVIYILGALGLAATVGLSWGFSSAQGVPVEAFYQYTRINVALEGAAVFVAFRYRVKGDGKLTGIVSRIAPKSLGVYVTHLMFLDFILPAVLRRTGVGLSDLNPAIAVPLTAAAVYSCALAFSWLFRKIPALGKVLM